MHDRRADILQRLKDAVLHGPGVLSPALRRQAAEGAATGPLAAFIDKVRRHAYRVSDDEVAALQRDGHSDDALFEVVVSAAVGQGLHRRQRALAALRGEP